ncbi:winged helix-turn-helix transcriptional regulator [Mycolicibacterium celeriflavum]|uniref:winged helix-turn-helix transcriptional regulator n=1 Tax=Mycolicibacterium celeriflavum TaxID=1249101 RepID=UPI003CFB1537
MSRDYGQYCGLARALDVVGDRWNLLIVRQLLVAPARYRDLRDGLPGIATNLLADRLRDLESAGVVERRLADDGAIIYALTEWGAQLREPIDGLIRWSTPLMIRGPEGDEFRPEWLMLALPAFFAGRARTKRRATVGVAVDGGMVRVRTTPKDIDVGMPTDGDEFDAVLRADASIVLGLAAGLLKLEDVGELIEIDGDEAALRAVFAAPRT